MSVAEVGIIPSGTAHVEALAPRLRAADVAESEAGLGLAPGNAFAPEAQGWLRWCFASKDPARLEAGVQRLQGWLATSARS